MESSSSVALVTTLAAVVGGVIVLVTIGLSLWARRRAGDDRAGPPARSGDGSNGDGRGE